MPPIRKRLRQATLQIPSSVPDSLSPSPDPNLQHLGQQAVLLQSQSQTIIDDSELSQQTLQDIDDPISSRSALHKISDTLDKLCRTTSYIACGQLSLSCTRALLLTSIVQNDPEILETTIFRNLCSQLYQLFQHLPSTDYFPSPSEGPSSRAASSYWAKIASLLRWRSLIISTVHSILQEHEHALQESTCRFLDHIDENELNGLQNAFHVLKATPLKDVRDFLFTKFADIFAFHPIPYIEYDDNMDVNDDSGTPPPNQEALRTA